MPGDVALKPLADAGSGLAHAFGADRAARRRRGARAAPACSRRRQRERCFAAPGCAGAHDEVVALARKLKAPIVQALRGKEHLEYDNPFDVGMTGLLGFASGYWAMKDCDTLLMLGTDFPYRQFVPARAGCAGRFGTELGNRCALDLGVARHGS